MRRVVVDASVAVKWFVPEILSDEAERFLDGTYELTVPDLIFPESGNILWKKVSRGELAAGEARDVLAALGHVPFVVVPSPALIEAALEVALGLQRSVYDGLYVALAVARGCTFVTADDRLVRSLAAGPLGRHVASLAKLA